MAAAMAAGIAGDLLGSVVNGLVGAGANAINQSVEFGYNQALQSNSFQHDKEMLAMQMAATRQLQNDLIGVREQALRRGGFTDSDAARGAVGAPMTKLVDWNGTRFSAPGAMQTSAYSGRFASQVTPRQRVQVPQVQAASTGPASVRDESDGLSTTSSSWGQPVASNSTSSTSLSRSSSSSVSSSDRVSSWVSEQNQLAPFHRNALRLTWGSSDSGSVKSLSSISSVSTVDGAILDSWTPAFNLQRQPFFARFHPRGSSNV
uniref:VP2 n=1 Tax=Norovirus GIV TaxID=262897 RepID=A0A455NXR4_NORV|nr:VP2 [Norovirus GIV]AZS32957.1 VP2 [Norovirus GIV]